MLDLTERNYPARQHYQDADDPPGKYGKQTAEWRFSERKHRASSANTRTGNHMEQWASC